MQSITVSWSKDVIVAFLFYFRQYSNQLDFLKLLHSVSNINQLETYQWAFRIQICFFAKA